MDAAELSKCATSARNRDAKGSFRVEYLRKPTYVHAIVTGENTKENIIGYLGDIARECAQQNCGYILIEERLTGPRLPMFDVFELAAEGAQLSPNIARGIAFVEVFDEGMMQFAETVAVNRGVPIKVFPDVDSAAKWLEKKAAQG